MKLKEIELVVRETPVKYDGREALIKDDIIKSTQTENNSSSKLTELLVNYFSLYNDEKERFISLLFDSKLKLIGIDLISVGTINQSLAHPREVFRKAVISGAAFVMIAHNHPSGDTTPSAEDIKVYRNLSECSEILNIKLLDSFIVSLKPEQESVLSMRKFLSYDN